MTAINSVITDSTYTLNLAYGTAHLTARDYDKTKQTAKPFWSYDFKNTSAPLIFYDPDLIPSGALPPEHQAWKDLELLFEELEYSEEDATSLTYESLREQRAREDRRVSKLYGTEGWD